MPVHEVYGEGYTHQILWNSAKLLLGEPENQTPRDGYFRIAGMLMTYFAFEAYLNLDGPRVDPDAWQNEREFFNSSAYREQTEK